MTCSENYFASSDIMDQIVDLCCYTFAVCMGTDDTREKYLDMLELVVDGKVAIRPSELKFLVERSNSEEFKMRYLSASVFIIRWVTIEKLEDFPNIFFWVGITLKKYRISGFSSKKVHPTHPLYEDNWKKILHPPSSLICTPPCRKKG